MDRCTRRAPAAAAPAATAAEPSTLTRGRGRRRPSGRRCGRRRRARPRRSRARRRRGRGRPGPGRAIGGRAPGRVHRAGHLPAGVRRGSRQVAAQVAGQARDEEPHPQARLPGREVDEQVAGHACGRAQHAGVAALLPDHHGLTPVAHHAVVDAGDRLHAAARGRGRAARRRRSCTPPGRRRGCDRRPCASRGRRARRRARRSPASPAHASRGRSTPPTEARSVPGPRPRLGRRLRGRAFAQPHDRADRRRLVAGRRADQRDGQSGQAGGQAAGQDAQAVPPAPGSRRARSRSASRRSRRLCGARVWATAAAIDARGPARPGRRREGCRVRSFIAASSRRPRAADPSRRPPARAPGTAGS